MEFIEVIPYENMDEALRRRQYRRERNITPKQRSSKKLQRDEVRSAKNRERKKERNKKYLCPEDGCPDRAWQNFKPFGTHLSIHGIYLFECRVCGDPFPREDAAVDHVAEHNIHKDLQDEIRARLRYKQGG
ncbi:hypothetical protein AA313_de0209841 [Arthrobotrys entomopaga]|nr:hypothetical protein AA313_de0209841 [Arthrobotrys entomopaga]